MVGSYTTVPGATCTRAGSRVGKKDPVLQQKTTKPNEGKAYDFPSYHMIRFNCPVFNEKKNYNAYRKIGK